MSDKEITERDFMMTPGKIMFFSWLNNLFLKKQATFNEDNYNIIDLKSYPSSWFSIGRNNQEKSPFIGIQQHMIPWFFETSWQKAFIVEEEGKLYLTCGNETTGDFTISIKVRKKRLKVLWTEETQKHLDFRIMKIGNNPDDIELSEKVYKRIPMAKVSSYKEVVAQSDFSLETKTEEYEDEIRERFVKIQSNKNNNDLNIEEDDYE